MRAKFVNELNEMTYEKMSVEEFVTWYNNLVEENPTLPWYNIVSSLENDEDSTDGELYEYFIDELGVEDVDHVIEELLEKREYFMDFRYAQEIDAQ